MSPSDKHALSHTLIIIILNGIIYTEVVVEVEDNNNNFKLSIL